jgi:hypothetical protein
MTQLREHEMSIALPPVRLFPQYLRLQGPGHICYMLNPPSFYFLPSNRRQRRLVAFLDQKCNRIYDRMTELQKGFCATLESYFLADVRLIQTVDFLGSNAH